MLLAALLIGLRPEHVFLAVLINVLYFLSKPTRVFIIGFSIFIIYWVIFDFMKAIPNYLYNRVHIQSLYDAEKNLFGIATTNGILTPNEYLRLNPQTLFDILSGIFYLCWVPVPLVFAAYLFYTNRKQFFCFSLLFLFINIIGFIIYYIYPAAPPWYVQHYGFVFHAATPGNTAGLARFDAFFNVNIFKSLYAKSSNVFAAMPSLHSAYPLLVFYFGIKNKLGAINIFFATVMLGIWCAAVYTSHHYILDVLAGIACAATGILLFNQFVLKTRKGNRFLNSLVKATA